MTSDNERALQALYVAQTVLTRHHQADVAIDLNAAIEALQRDDSVVEEVVEALEELSRHDDNSVADKAEQALSKLRRG